MYMAESRIINLEQIKFMNELQKLKQQIGTVQKTILLYQVYNPTDLQLLTNLHAIASKIVDPQSDIQIIRRHDEDEDTVKYYHKVNPRFLDYHKSIKVFTFQLEGQGITEYQWEKKVQIYDSTLHGDTIRIVALPIPQRFLKTDDVKAMNLEIENMKRAKYQETKYLVWQELGNKQKQWQQNIADKIAQFQQEEGKNHLKIFRLEAILSVLTAKTEKISLCGIIEYNFFKPNVLEDVKKELTSIFKFPADLHPKYILHSHPTPERIQEKVHEYVSSSEITIVYNLDKKQKRINLNRGRNYELFHEQHFTTYKQFSISLYSLRLSNNRFMAAVIQKFTDEWSTTVSNAITPIGHVVASVYNSLVVKKNQNSSSDQIDADTTAVQDQFQILLPQNTEKIQFADLTKMYKQFKDFYLEDNVQLNDFYTLNKLKIRKLQEDEEMIPSQIAELTFLFYFGKLNKNFLQKFNVSKNQGYQNLMEWIDSYIHTVCELIKHINDSLLAKGQGLNRCSNLQTYLKFIKFLLNSTILIKKITNRSLAVTGNIKKLFEGLKLNDNWIIDEHIINNRKSIQQRQSIHYYDFLLMFIRNEKNEQTGSKINDDQIADDENIVSIFVTIHKYKADQIANKFIYDKPLVVEAVRSYCQYILKYDYLVVNKMYTFDKFKIEKEIALLLWVIKLPGEAAIIYQRLHMVDKVEECLNQMIFDYSGDKISAKILEFAKFFQDQFAYTLAEKYYQKAYSTAQTTNSRKLAQKNLLECRKRMITARIEDLAIITKYIEQKGSQQDFVRTRFSTRQTEEEESVKLEEGLSQYRRLLSKLTWDESIQKAIILNEDVLDKSLQSDL